MKSGLSNTAHAGREGDVDPLDGAPENVPWKIYESKLERCGSLAKSGLSSTAHARREGDVDASDGAPEDAPRKIEETQSGNDADKDYISKSGCLPVPGTVPVRLTPGV